MSRKKLTFIFAVITMILGTLFHFIYDWSGNNFFVGLFGAINESTYEHTKLLIMPMLLLYPVEYFVYGKNERNFSFIKALSILFGAFLIITAYYTYSGVLGQDIMFIDIAIYYVAVVIAYYVGYEFMKYEFFSSGLWTLVGYILLIAIFAITVLFTVNPPKIDLFEDIHTQEYGIYKEKKQSN